MAEDDLERGLSWLDPTAEPRLVQGENRDDIFDATLNKERGSQVVVYYSPSNPARALLEPDIVEGNYFVSLFGAFSFGAGLMVFITAPASIQRQRDARVTSVLTITIR